MVNINNYLKLPKYWEEQSNSFKNLVSEANKNLKHSLKESIEIIFELVYGTLEYLESDAIELAKTENIINNPRIKSYEDQLLSLINTLEFVSQENPEIAKDRYLLYIEIFKKLLYIDLDAISFFIRFLHLNLSKINVKKIDNDYLVDFIIFGTEIAILGGQDANKKSFVHEIYQELTKLIGSSHFNSIEFIYPLIAYGISNERNGNFSEAAKAYYESLTRINAIKDNKEEINDRIDEIPLQMIHETIFFGYITSFIGDNFEKYGNEFYSFLNMLDENVANILRATHSILYFGYNVNDAFSHITSEDRSAFETVDFYLRSSSVQSKQENNSLWLEHIEAKNYLSVIENKSKVKGAQEGIVLVESKNLKGIQVYSEKNKLLPSLNVYPGEYSNYVLLGGVRFNVNNQFAFGQTFQEEIEIIVNFNKKTFLKKKFKVKDKIPPFFVLDLTNELNELVILKEGGTKKFDTIWSNNMPLIKVIKNIIDLDNSYFTKSENQIKEFLKDLGNLFKKIHLKKEEKIIQEMLKQESTYMLKGKTLKIVILQKLATLDASNTEIEFLLKKMIQ